jgi:hypothetical protein
MEQLLDVNSEFVALLKLEVTTDKILKLFLEKTKLHLCDNCKCSQGNVMNACKSFFWGCVNQPKKGNNSQYKISKISEGCSTTKDTNSKVNDKCSHTLSSICSQMWRQWDLLSVLHLGPSTWKAGRRLCFKWLGWGRAHDSTPHGFTQSRVQ